MPSLYNCLLLAKSMREDVPIPSDISFYIDNSSDSSFSSLGYFGKIYLDHARQEILFVHRSTTIDGNVQNSESSSLVGSSNIVSDASIYYQKLPKETVIALRFVERNYQELLKDYPTYVCVHIGHSLGGFHAHFCGYSLKQRVIAIDPPGSKEVIQQHFSELDDMQCENHISIFLYRNLINKTNQHLGRLAYYADDELSPGKLNIEESRDTLKTHSLELFLEHIPETSLDPKDELPVGFSWRQSRVTIQSKLYNDSSESKSSYSSSLYQKPLKRSAQEKNPNSTCIIL